MRENNLLGFYEIDNNQVESLRDRPQGDYSYCDTDWFRISLNAGTAYAFNLRGAPTGHTLPIREVRLSAGAGFVVALAGDIMVWEYDRADFSLRLDVESGPLERILIEALTRA